MQQFLWRTRASGRNVLEHRQSESVSLQISTLLPAAVAARLEDFILVILSSFLIDSHQFLPTDLPAENPLEVLRLPGQVSSLRAGQFLLLRLPFLLALGHVDPNRPRAEVSTTDVAGHECWWHGGCVGSQSSTATSSTHGGQRIYSSVSPENDNHNDIILTIFIINIIAMFANCVSSCLT